MAASWDYKQQGADWTSLDYCDDNQQSPIDLKDDFDKVYKPKDMFLNKYTAWSTAQRIYGH